jgi:4-hydroxy-tetrahydrodipicolinate synthase
MQQNNLIGSMTALITPFKNSKIDENCYEKLIKRQINQGINVIVPVGTTGESTTLSHEEHKKCIQIAVDVCKNSNTQVIAGAGSNCTAEAINLASFAQKIGCDGILSVTPYYNKPSQEGLYQHYKAIASSIDIPVLLYNVPSRTGVDLEANTTIRLFDDIKNIYGIKEATGSLQRCVELLSKRKDLKVLCGDDAIDFPMLSNGANGIISVTANLLPNLKSKLVKNVFENNLKEARDINNELYELNDILFIQSNPIMIKAAMYLCGLIDNLEYRLPLIAPCKNTLEKLEKVLDKYEVIK